MDRPLLPAPHPPPGLVAPAIEVFFFVSLMLGVACMLMLAAMTWAATPEAIRFLPLSPGASLVRGGQSFSDAAPSLAPELLSAIELIVIGAVGLGLVRRSYGRIESRD